MSDLLRLAGELIERRSVTPDDAGCQGVIASRLAPLGFTLEHRRFGQVDNLWARRGNEAPLLLFAGHTDVVPPGPDSLWKSPPFEPGVFNGRLYGRGVADMKGGLAAMVVAVKAFIASHPYHKGSIAFLVTSDEEGEAVDGTARMVEHLKREDTRVDYCLLGEPSSEGHLGDTIKIGRRGSLNALLTIHGIQGHVAYPDLADNPIHSAQPVLEKLINLQWDEGNEHFPPTRLQISSIQSGTGADNMIPGHLEASFNIRFSDRQDVSSMQRRVRDLLENSKVDYDIEWKLSALPFLSRPGTLVDAARQAIHEVTGISARLATSGGTSDGRFLNALCGELIEFGLCNDSIHQANENARTEDLEKLKLIYQKILEHLLR